MAGIVNENIVFPVLDLIRAELRKLHLSEKVIQDPFEGIPSVTIFREHPLDPEVVTGAELLYDSLYVMDIYLKFGSEDESTYPDGVDINHHDYDYYRNWRLTHVTTSVLDPNGDTIITYHISLNYDNRGFLTGTTVSRIN